MQGKSSMYDDFIDMAKYLDNNRAPKANMLGMIEGFRIHETIEYRNLGYSEKLIKFVTTVYEMNLELQHTTSKKEFLKYLPYLASSKILDTLDIKRVSASNRYRKRMRIHALNLGMSTKSIDEIYTEYLKSFLR